MMEAAGMCRSRYGELEHTEPVFVNILGAQESNPRNLFRQPMLSYRPARLGIDSWAPYYVYKNGLIARIFNVYGAQESIRRNEFRQPMYPGGPVRQPYSYLVPSPPRFF
jgi:hypothetical protein